MTDDRLELQVFYRDFGLDDIRNCSWASGVPLVTVSGVSPTTRCHELWSISCSTDGGIMLTSMDYLLYNAVDCRGERVALTGGPATSRDDVSLHVYDVRARKLDCVVNGSIARNSIPSWCPNGLRVAVSSVQHEILIWSLEGPLVEAIMRGDCPAYSPDGLGIAFVRDCRICVSELSNLTKTVVVWDGRLVGDRLLPMISWSIDGRYLMVAMTAGVTRKEIRFARIEIKTGVVRIYRHRGLRGLLFR